MSINNITGDKIQTKPSTKEFEEGWERVFGKKCIKEGKEEALKNAQEIRKSRIDIIGSNGNDGLHYGALCTTCGKELEKVTECAWTSCPKWLEETK